MQAELLWRDFFRPRICSRTSAAGPRGWQRTPQRMEQVDSALRLWLGIGVVRPRRVASRLESLLKQRTSAHVRGRVRPLSFNAYVVTAGSGAHKNLPPRTTTGWTPDTSTIGGGLPQWLCQKQRIGPSRKRWRFLGHTFGWMHFMGILDLGNIDLLK